MIPVFSSSKSLRPLLMSVCTACT